MTYQAKGCPTAKTAALLSDPWTMLLVRDLLRAPRRFCDLERSLEGISTRTLTAKLKNLEQERVVRKSAAGLYAPTPKGKALGPVCRAMERYGKKYL